MGRWTAIFSMLTLMVFSSAVTEIAAKQTSLNPHSGQHRFSSSKGSYRPSAILAHDDDRTPASRDNRFRDNYNRWRDLSPEEKKLLRNRMDRLKNLPPRQKERYQERSQQWERLPAEDKNRIRQSVRRWNELTPEERRKIRRQLDKR